jgi:hypothetical protein
MDQVEEAGFIHGEKLKKVKTKKGGWSLPSYFPCKAGTE